LTEELLARKERALLGGRMDKINRQHEKGLVAARERIAMLADAGTFVEFGQLHTSDQSGNDKRAWLHFLDVRFVFGSMYKPNIGQTAS
jgi:methylmalonyl-CoA decarboxylase subunit alpha